MKEIFNEFKNGNSREKLSIISDFSTILGVSVATFVAGPFLSKFTSTEFVLSDFIVSILFYFVCLYFSGFLLYGFVKSFNEVIRARKYRQAIFNSIYFLLAVWFATVLFPYAKYYTGNVFNASYLLAPIARSAVKNVLDVKVLESSNITKMSISLSLIKGASHDDYIALIYMQDDNGLYSAVSYGDSFNREYEHLINNQGKILAPLKLSAKKIESPYLVIFRKSDWSLLEKSGGSFSGYPSLLTQIPTNEIDALGAYVYRLDIKV